MKKIILFGLVLFCTSCSKYNSEIEKALNIAKDNKKELELVINHYQNPKDSLKLKAVFFLLENMRNQYSLSGKKFKIRDEIFQEIEKLEKNNPLKGNYQFPKVDSLWERISKKHDPFNTSQTKIEPDLEYISSELLIENIEYAFKAWEMPWSKHLNFEEFCEYILPYRSTKEELESWRPFYYEKFKWVLDSIQDKSDPVEACALVNKNLTSWFRFCDTFNKYGRAIGPMDLWKGKMGVCRDQNSLAIFAMRAIGIPVVHENIPYWANRSMGHDFTAVLNRKGEFVDFLGAELQPGDNEIRNIVPKVFRQTYEIQRDTKLSSVSKKKLPSKLRSNNFIDITKNYTAVSDVKIKLSFPPKDVKKVFFGVFDNKSWNAVGWASIEKDSTAEFTNMGRNVTYLPLYYVNGRYKTAYSPINIDSLGIIHELTANKKKTQEVTLKRKYYLSSLKLWWKTLMVNGTFQGANKFDFSDADNLYTIEKPIDLREHKLVLKNQRKYQFVRYLFPDGTYGSLGEVGFYTQNKEKSLKEILIKDKRVSERDLQIAFDGEFNKYIHTEKIDDYNGAWVGLNLRKSIKITEISFCPRTDQNNIEKGMNYELFYWHKTWVSLGRKVAGTNKLYYKNVPTNALFLLRNLTEGKEERIFTYKKGAQIWW